MLILLGQSHKIIWMEGRSHWPKQGPRVGEGLSHEQHVGSVTRRKEGRCHTGKHPESLPQFCCAEVHLLAVPAHRVTWHESPSPLPRDAYLKSPVLPPPPGCPSSVHLPSSPAWLGSEPSYLSEHFLLKTISFVFSFIVCRPE